MNRYVQSLGLLLFIAGSVEAQTATLYDVVWLVQPGDTLTITDNAGVRVRGKLVQLSTDSLMLEASRTIRQFPESEIATIERRGDSLKNGALSGFAAGGVLGATLAALADGGSGSDWNFGSQQYLLTTSAFGGLGAAIGVGIDALIRGNQIVYARSRSIQPSVSVAPLLRRGQKGVLMSVRMPMGRGTP